MEELCAMPTSKLGTIDVRLSAGASEVARARDAMVISG